MTNLTALPAGTELVGDYRIERILGAGGFGITYLADEIALGRQVTIKEFFPADFAARTDGIDAAPRSQGCAEDYRWGLDRFIDEAQTLAKFNHPNIVRVYRYFRANNTGYMVLHFEEGQSLKSWLKSLGRAPRQQELDKLLTPLLDALELIHSRDFLHRDIAPDNIIVRKDGTPVLIDFGSARGEIMAHSKTVSALVKPGYSPYEQYAETTRQQGPWTDIYALGATLYHAVTGKRPSDSPSRMVKDELPPARNAALAAYRSGFLNAIDHALALKIEKRPKSIKIWRKALLTPDPPKTAWLSRTKRERAAPAKQPNKKQPAKAAVKQPDPKPAPSELHQAANAQSNQMLPARAPHVRLGDLLAKLKIPTGKPGAQKEKPAHAAQQNQAEIAAEPAQSPNQAKEIRLPRIFRQDKAGTDIAIAAKKVRPRAIRRRGGSFWRPLFVKFLIGVGVASAAVALQDRFPHYEYRGTSEVSATKAVVPKTIPPKKPPSWDGRPVAELRGHGGPATAAKFSDDGRYLASVTADAKMRIWNPRNQQIVRTIELDNGPALSFAIRDSFALTGHSRGEVVLWNWQTAAKLGTFKRNDAEIWSVTFLGSTDRFAAASHDWKVSLWSTQNTSAPLQVLNAHKNAAKSLAYGRRKNRELLVTGGADKRVKLWNLNTLDLIRTFRGHRDFVTTVALSPDGLRIAAGALDGTVKLWNTQSRRVKRTLKGHRARVTHVAFSPDGGTLASSAADGQIRIRSTAKGRTLRTLTGHAGPVNSVVFSPDGSQLASAGEDGVVRIWPNPAYTATSTAQR